MRNKLNWKNILQIEQKIRHQILHIKYFSDKTKTQIYLEPTSNFCRYQHNVFEELRSDLPPTIFDSRSNSGLHTVDSRKLEYSFSKLFDSSNKFSVP